MPLAILSGSETQNGTYGNRLTGDLDPIADLQVEARKKERVRDRAEYPILLGQQTRERRVGVGHEVPGGGIGAVNGLHFHEGRALVASQSHGAQGRHHRNLALCVEDGTLVRCRLTVL